MTIEFNCPHCQKFLKTADDKAGLKANCPGCGEVIEVPRQSQLADEEQFPTSEPPPLPGQEAMKNCPMCGERIKAGATKCRYCGEMLDEADMPRPEQGHYVPHRGTLILIFGILSFFVCCLFGIAAWVMGNQDLAEMDAGRMDPEGRGMTQAGRIIGMVHVFIMLAVGILYIVFVGLMIAVGQ